MLRKERKKERKKERDNERERERERKKETQRIYVPTTLLNSFFPHVEKVR